LATSTVQNILKAAGEGRLGRGDRVTDTKPVRYQREVPGELIHASRTLAVTIVILEIRPICRIPDCADRSIPLCGVRDICAGCQGTVQWGR
jgi:hypothetical protein